MASSKVLVLVFTVFLLTASLIHCENEDTESKTKASGETKEEEDAGKKDVVKDSGMEQENGVLVLTTENFDDIVESSDSILVEFYAPWCGHCKSLAPQYEKAAEMLKESDQPVPLAKVDATKEPKLASRFDVTGYPTLKFFKNGQPYDYDGPRDADGIVAYVKERSDPSWVPPPPPASNVLTLTESNFTETVDSSELILVEFYAPWCGHCKRLTPELEKAAKVLKDSDVPIAKVDATAETSLGKRFDVSGYPTLKVFRRGKAFEYKGPRESDGIVDYMLGQVGEGSKELMSQKKMAAYMHAEDVTVIGFFASAEDAAYNLFQDVANDMREQYKFGHTIDKDIANHYKVNAGSVVVFNAERFYTKHEPKWHILELKDTTKADDVVAFIKSHDVPLVGHMTMDLEEKRYHSERRPLVLFFYTVDWSHEHRSGTQFWRNKVADIAKDYPKIVFAIVDEDDFPEKVKSFGFDDSGEEMNIGILDKEKKYSMEEMEEFDADDIREFINKFNKGKLTPQIKSQPIPKKQTGPVTVVVGKTFDKIVLDPKKDALIEFYAHYCDVSKKFVPVYNKLAKKFKGNSNLVVAKMDAVLNDVPSEYDAPPEKGYPAIYFAPADKKMAPIKYEGDQDFNGLVKFVEKHATVLLKKKKEEL